MKDRQRDDPGKNNMSPNPKGGDITIAVSTANSWRKVADQSLTSCKTYRRLIGDHTLIPNMGIRWLHWFQQSPVNHNEISREEVVSWSQCLCNRSFTNSVPLIILSSVHSKIRVKT